MFAWVRSTRTGDFGTTNLLVFGGANCPAETKLSVVIARETPITTGAYMRSAMEQVSVDYTVGRSTDPDFVWFANSGRDFDGGTVVIDELTDDVVSGSFDVELEDVIAFPRSLKRFRGTFRIPMVSGSTCGL